MVVASTFILQLQSLWYTFKIKSWKWQYSKVFLRERYLGKWQGRKYVHLKKNPDRYLQCGIKSYLGKLFKLNDCLNSSTLNWENLKDFNQCLILIKMSLEYFLISWPSSKWPGRSLHQKDRSYRIFWVLSWFLLPYPDASIPRPLGS